MGSIDNFFKQEVRSLKLTPQAGDELLDCSVVIQADWGMRYDGGEYPFRLEATANGLAMPESALAFKWHYGPASFLRPTATGYEFRGRKGNKVGVFNTATGENSIGGGCIQPVVLSALEQRGLLVFSVELTEPGAWDEATLVIFEGDRTETVNENGIRLSVSDPEPTWINPLRIISVRQNGKNTELTVGGPSAVTVSLEWRPSFTTPWQVVAEPNQKLLTSKQNVVFTHNTTGSQGFYRAVATILPPAP